MEIREIDGKFGTPFYLYHSEKICSSYMKLKGVLFPGACLYYSMKANPLGKICCILNGMGAGIEVASKGELEIALNAGVSPDKIIFTSPGKTEKELRTAIAKKIKLINIDSLEEAILINHIGEERKGTIDVAIRINPAVNCSNAKIKMTGIASQFGIEEEDLDTVFYAIKELKNINVCGFQIYMGTQMLQADDIVKNTDYALGLFIAKAKQYGICLKTVNVGGGFGIRYFANENDLDLDRLRECMKILYEKYHKELDETEIIFESGRFIMAEAGEFVTKVLHVKKSKNTKFVICDGGSNFHSSAAFLGRFVRNNFPLRSVPEGEEMEVANIVGPLCTPLDVIGQKVLVNKEIKTGDYVIIEKSGAYGLTYSPIEFLSHERPNEILEEEEGYSIIGNQKLG